MVCQFYKFFNPIFGRFLTIVPTVLWEGIDDLKTDTGDTFLRRPRWSDGMEILKTPRNFECICN